MWFHIVVLQRMAKKCTVLKQTYWAVVLHMRSSVLPHPPCHCGVRLNSPNASCIGQQRTEGQQKPYCVKTFLASIYANPVAKYLSDHKLLCLVHLVQSPSCIFFKFLKTTDLLLTGSKGSRVKGSSSTQSKLKLLLWATIV